VKKWVGNGVWAALGAVIMITALAAYQGIIGNRADSIFIALTNWVATSVHENTIPWIITAVTIGLFFVEGGWCVFHNKVLNQAIKKAHKMIALDGSLLRNIANLQPENVSGSQSPQLFHRDKQTTRILRDILRDAVDELREHLPGNEHILRTAIVTPDATGDYLKCIASWEMPLESIDSMEFYIGNDAKLRRDRGGAAGEAYINKKLVRGHMIKLGDRWTSRDCTSYIDFAGNRSSQPYISFANVPIIGPDPRTQDITCFGVVCFDSKHEKAFDSDESKELLTMLAERIAAAIILCKRIC
jgi:hypothetical protein